MPNNEETTENLLEIISQLKHLVSNSEDQFLLIGSRLNYFLRLATRVAETSTITTNALSATGGKLSISELQSMLGEIDAYVTDSQARTGAAKTGLESIQSTITGIGKPIASLVSTLKMLKMLGISTKIESSTLGDSRAAFYQVAGQIDELSRLIKLKATDILSKEKALATSTKQALSKVGEFEIERVMRAKAMIEEANSQLDSLSSTNEKCSNTTAFIAAAAQGVTSNIQEIVQAIQFHDIARQKIEHVGAGLYDLCENSFLKPGKDEVVTTEAAETYNLQAGELSSAGRDLIAANNQITASLQSVADHVGGISLRADEVAGIAEQSGKTLFAKVEQSLTVITDSLRMTAQSSDGLFSDISFLTDAAKEMSDFIADTENIVLEIELIAVNAQIKAAAIGDEGVALGVLADFIKQLSITVSGEITAIPQSLTAIIATAQELREVLGIDGENRQDSIVSGLAQTLASLMAIAREANNDLNDDLSQLTESACTLVDEIESTIAGTTIDREAANVISRSISEMDRLTVSIGDVRGLQRVARSADDLGADFYETMKTLAEVVTEGNEFGGNVELF